MEILAERRILRRGGGQAVLTYVSRLRAACLALLVCGAPALIPVAAEDAGYFVGTAVGACSRHSWCLPAIRPARGAVRCAPIALSSSSATPPHAFRVAFDLGECGEAAGDGSERAEPARGARGGAGRVPGSGGGKRLTGMAERLTDLKGRLTELKDRLTLVEAGLAQLDRKVAARLDEQMARIVLAVAELLNQRSGRPTEPRAKRQSWPKIAW